ncbi:MAG: hypothetical protein ACT4NY_07345 [Pseudonocardiales bacterium]
MPGSCPRSSDKRADGGSCRYKLTTGLAATVGTVVVEDLNVAGMLRNRKLARGIADAGVAGDLEPHGSNGRGANRKTPPGGAGGREASTPHRLIAGQDGDRPLVTAGCT